LRSTHPTALRHPTPLLRKSRNFISVRLYANEFPAPGACNGRGVMPHIATADGVNLYYEEVGSGTPIVFVHEYAGDYHTCEQKLRYFARAHRCVTYSQRGYPPSDIPSDAKSYGQDIARDDVIALMDALKIETAHVVGHSMGAYTALHVGIHYPQR